MVLLCARSSLPRGNVDSGMSGGHFLAGERRQTRRHHRVGHHDPGPKGAAAAQHRWRAAVMRRWVGHSGDPDSVCACCCLPHSPRLSHTPPWLQAFCCTTSSRTWRPRRAPSSGGHPPPGRRGSSRSYGDTIACRHPTAWRMARQAVRRLRQRAVAVAPS